MNDRDKKMYLLLLGVSTIFIASVYFMSEGTSCFSAIKGLPDLCCKFFTLHWLELGEPLSQPSPVPPVNLNLTETFSNVNLDLENLPEKNISESKKSEESGLDSDTEEVFEDSNDSFQRVTNSPISGVNVDFDPLNLNKNVDIIDEEVSSEDSPITLSNTFPTSGSTKTKKSKRNI